MNKSIKITSENLKNEVKIIINNIFLLFKLLIAIFSSKNIYFLFNFFNAKKY